MSDPDYAMIQQVVVERVKRAPFDAEDAKLMRRGEGYCRSLVARYGVEQSICSDGDKKVDRILKKYPAGCSLEINATGSSRALVLAFVPVDDKHVFALLKRSNADEEDTEGTAGVNCYYLREMKKVLMECLSGVFQGLFKADGRVLSIARDISVVEFRSEAGVYTTEFPTRRLIRVGVDRTDCRVRHVVYEVGTLAISDLQAVEGHKQQAFSWADLPPLTKDFKKRMRKAEEQAGDSGE